jgi:hypothetical protein
LDPRVPPPGGSSTLSTSAWPNDAVVCSLSSVLEPAVSIPSRFFLSSRACAGILRRAVKRNKTLPPILEAALRAVVGTEQDTPEDETEE